MLLIQAIRNRVSSYAFCLPVYAPCPMLYAICLPPFYPELVEGPHSILHPFLPQAQHSSSPQGRSSISRRLRHFGPKIECLRLKNHWLFCKVNRLAWATPVLPIHLPTFYERFFLCHSHRVKKLLYLKWFKILKFVAIWKYKD